MSTLNLGRSADAIKTGKAFDLSRWRANTPEARSQPFRNPRNPRGSAADAAGASGFAFLQSSLELLEPRLVEPLQAVTHPRDITVKFGGGFPEQIAAYALNVGSSGGGQYGLQGTENNDVPIAQADLQKETVNTFIWSQAFKVSHVSLERMKLAQRNGTTPPITLQQMYEKSVRVVWGKALDLVTYTGFLGQAGIINNPNVPVAVAPSGGSGTTWATKSPAQILADVNFGINQTVQNSGYDIQSGAADTLLLPYNQYALLTQPMNIGGIGYDSTIEYIRRNCVSAQYFGDKERFKIFPLPNPWISGQGIGNTVTTPGTQGNGLDRAVFYRNDEESLLLRVPTAMEPAMTIPDGTAGPGYATYFVGCIAQVMFLRTTTQFYFDGV